MFSEPVMPQVSVILPCLDEEESITRTIQEAWEGLHAGGYHGEVVVVDNGSTDCSVQLATAAGARVVSETVRGYGAALRRGIAEARGQIGVMADADLTYDLPNLGQLVSRVEAGADLAMASRLDGLNSGTMPFLHRIFGTPVLSFMLRRITHGEVSIRDSQSGYRAFNLNRIRALHLQGSGMEFASEMLFQASLASYQIEETRLPYRERIGQSKLNTLEDGLRHLKLLTLLAPRMALLWPGVIFAVFGLGLTAASLIQPAGLGVGEATWQPVFFAPIALVMSSLLLVIFKVLQEASPLRADLPIETFPNKTRSRILAVGATTITAGVAINLVLFATWLGGNPRWQNSLALAGLAQALILSGAIWVTSAFLYWLIQRQSEYGIGRDQAATQVADANRQ
ncbi:MAG: glycosyltransferase family 2 protein [Acidimicrobiales bacterium]